MCASNVVGPSNSTSTSTSLSGLASSRATEPKSASDRTPNSLLSSSRLAEILAMTSARRTKGSYPLRLPLEAQSMVQAVCECVRIKPSHACASALSCTTFVRGIRVSSRQHSKFTSLRGWRWQHREGSSPFFRTRLRSPVRPSELRLGRGRSEKRARSGDSLPVRYP